MPHWDLNNPHLMSAKETSVANVSQYLIGSKFPGMGTAIGKGLSLHRYLKDHTNIPAATLASQITVNGGPMFTPKDIEEMRVRMKKAPTAIGGGIRKPVKGDAAAAIDPSRSHFWDRFIRKIASPISSRIPESLDGVFYYVFILYSLEHMDLFGPMFSTALDAITLSLPIMAELAQTGVEKLFMIAPIPYAGLVGEIGGMVIGIVFLIVAFNLNVSRKYFGTAFKNVLEMVPFIGDILEDAATNFETGAERALMQRSRIVDELQKVSPHASNVFDHYAPDIDSHNGQAPNLNVQAIGKDFQNFAIAKTGMSKNALKPMMKMVDTVSNMRLNKLTNISAMTGALSNVTGSATAMMPNITKPLSKVTSALSNVTGSATAIAANITKPLSAAAANITKPLSAAAANITKPLSAAAANITKPLSNAAANITKPLSAAAANITKPLSAAAANITKPLVAAAKNITKPLAAAAANATNAATGLVKNVTKAVVQKSKRTTRKKKGGNRWTRRR